MIQFEHRVEKNVIRTLLCACFILFLINSFTFEAYAQSKAKSSAASKTPIKKEHTKVFQEISPDISGIHFLNLTPGPSEMKKESRLFTIASGGTSVGDINGDGLLDIYLTSFKGYNSLFINKGNLTFEKAPLSAGVTDSAGSCFGSTMVDIDGDGDLDIYVTKYNFDTNKLYINDGKGNFTDKAKEFGLQFIANGIQSTFFDFDLDGDLDVLVVNNGIQRAGYKHVGVQPKLMRNNGNNTFSDFSDSCGIDHKGFGLSATSSDINNDGWPDIYIANDFEEKDYLYINKKNGTFERMTKAQLPHTVMFGMGNDIADFNNDGLMDIIAVDMLPETHIRLNTQFDNFTTFNSTFDSSQFIQNTLQLNRGNGRFSDIAQMSGIDATEWSWSVFFADFDLDGNKDIFVANGLKWDVMDKDFNRLGITHDKMEQISKEAMKEASDSAQIKGDIRAMAETFDIGNLIRQVKRTRVPNYLFRNNGDLTFKKVSDEWGMDIPYNTCSSAYADFDNDGDLDMILNTIDSTAVLYKNTMMESGNNHYLKVQCIGNTPNTKGIGAKIIVKTGNTVQTVQLTSTRGFASGIAAIGHFGLGANVIADELTIIWPGGAQQTLLKIKADQTLTLKQADAIKVEQKPLEIKPLLEEITAKDSGAISFLHKENDFDDFYNERLLPNQLSINGPSLASGDIDGNGLDDIVIGGPQGFPLQIFYQKKEGVFSQAQVQNIFANDSMYEDQSILLFDVENDGDIDMYVASGGNEDAAQNPSLMFDRLYLNDGKGGFTKGILPEMPVSKSCVIGSDFDNDGDIDLFIGGRNIAGNFAKQTRSYLLLNNQGFFTDVTEVLAFPLLNPGHVKSALWSDYDNDGDPDLLVVGDWMKILVLQNNSGVFSDKSLSAGIDTSSGMWNSINGGDIDNDGDIDYVVGNVGTNTRYNEPNEQNPFVLYAADFDDNGSTEYIQGYYENGILFPSRVSNSIIGQMPTLRRKFVNFDDIAPASLSVLVGGDSVLKNALYSKAAHGRSIVLINNGNGKFTWKDLPVISQISPVFGTILEDINEDGNLDIIHAGNFYGPDREMWRFDAGVGQVLLGNGKGEFSPLSVLESGVYVPGEARAAITVPLKDKNAVHFIIASCKNKVQTFQKRLSNGSKIIGIDPKKKINKAIVQFKNGQKRMTEFYMGSGYYSQSSHYVLVNKDVKEITFMNGETIISTLKY
jgi:hypothetical protein